MSFINFPLVIDSSIPRGKIKVIDARGNVFWIFNLAPGPPAPKSNIGQPDLPVHLL